MTKIKRTVDKTVKRKRDDVTHKCDVLFLTKLTIGGDNFKYRKKDIEKKLIELELTTELKKYSKYNTDISFVVSHKVKDYSLIGFLKDENTKYNKLGVLCNLNKDIKTCIFGNEKHNHVRSAILSEETEQFSKIRNTLETLNNLSATSEKFDDASFKYLLTQTTQIQQQLYLVDNDSEEGGSEYMRKVTNGGYGSGDYDYDIVSFYNCTSRNHIERFTKSITSENFEEQFKLKEYLDKLEENFNSKVDHKFTIDLNKTYEVTFTDDVNIDKNVLSEKAINIVIKKIVETWNDSEDTTTSDDLTVVSSSHSSQKESVQ
jgi:ABC-type antimicrobial peptide transport system permease subunit